MLKRLHLDLVGGIAGDMFSSAVSGLLKDEEAYLEMMQKLPISDWRYSYGHRVECGMSARVLKLEVPKPEHHLCHVPDIAELINKADLPEQVSADALKMLNLLANAEAKVHGTTVEKIHFHELAGYDIVFDLVSAAALVYLLDVGEITCTPLPMGIGNIHIAHGEMPLPAPAVLELLKGLPVKETNIKGETVTPTGAAIVRYYTNKFVSSIGGTISAAGIGAGMRENDSLPNIVRAILLEQGEILSENLVVLESNIDDMNPEHFDLTFDRLFEAGALDVWLKPILMKKNRPANTLSVLCRSEQENHLRELIYSNTSTIGIRKHEVSRDSLSRVAEKRTTDFGEVLGKTINHPEGQVWIAEYDELKRIAIETGFSIRQISNKMPNK